ncbi:MAG: hypothetical protein ACXABY_26620 [Candidatus Thorarchaeota archaeon]|jgi:hypothetical protein
MTSDFIAFDLEIAKVINDPDVDWKEQRPLGISCAAVAYYNETREIVYQDWHSNSGKTSMTDIQCRAMIKSLEGYVLTGKRIVTVNGAGFDFDVLAEESGWHSNCVDLAMDHVDLCFLVLSMRGHFLGLDAMAKGAGVIGKLHDVRLNDGTLLEDMGGAKAPQLWADGERSAVMAYLRDDVRATLQTAEMIESTGMIGWTSRKGKWNSYRTPTTGLLNVAGCLTMRMPNNSWMTNPPTREGVLAWTKPVNPAVLAEEEVQDDIPW